MKRIVVIENDEDILDVVSIILEEQGYEIIPGEDATVLEQLPSQPDLIILDEKLGTENGSSICKRYKADPHTANIPVILMSATDHLDELAKACNADGYLEKPFAIDDCVACVDALLNPLTGKACNIG